MEKLDLFSDSDSELLRKIAADPGAKKEAYAEVQAALGMGPKPGIQVPLPPGVDALQLKPGVAERLSELYIKKIWERDPVTWSSEEKAAIAKATARALQQGY